jgi:hypothetical protein
MSPLRNTIKGKKMRFAELKPESISKSEPKYYRVRRIGMRF